MILPKKWKSFQIYFIFTYKFATCRKKEPLRYNIMVFLVLGRPTHHCQSPPRLSPFRRQRMPWCHWGCSAWSTPGYCLLSWKPPPAQWSSIAVPLPQTPFRWIREICRTSLKILKNKTPHLYIQLIPERREKLLQRFTEKSWKQMQY